MFKYILTFVLIIIAPTVVLALSLMFPSVNWEPIIFIPAIISVCVVSLCEEPHPNHLKGDSSKRVTPKKKAASSAEKP